MSTIPSPSIPKALSLNNDVVCKIIAQSVGENEAKKLMSNNDEWDLTRELRNYTLIHWLLQNHPNELISNTPPIIEWFGSTQSPTKLIGKRGRLKTAKEEPGVANETKSRVQTANGYLYLYDGKIPKILERDGLTIQKEKKVHMKIIVQTNKGGYKIKNHRSDVGIPVIRRQTRAGVDSNGTQWRRIEYKLFTQELSWTTVNSNNRVNDPNLSEGNNEASGNEVEVLDSCISAGINLNMKETLVLQEYPILVHYFIKSSGALGTTTSLKEEILTEEDDDGNDSENSLDEENEESKRKLLKSSPFSSASSSTHTPNPPTNTTTTFTPQGQNLNLDFENEDNKNNTQINNQNQTQNTPTAISSTIFNSQTRSVQNTENPPTQSRTHSPLHMLSPNSMLIPNTPPSPLSSILDGIEWDDIIGMKKKSTPSLQHVTTPTTSQSTPPLATNNEIFFGELMVSHTTQKSPSNSSNNTNNGNNNNSSLILQSNNNISMNIQLNNNNNTTQLPFLQTVQNLPNSIPPPPHYLPSHLQNIAQIRSYAPDFGSHLEHTKVLILIHGFETVPSVSLPLPTPSSTSKKTKSKESVSQPTLPINPYFYSYWCVLSNGVEVLATLLSPGLFEFSAPPTPCGGFVNFYLICRENASKAITQYTHQAPFYYVPSADNPAVRLSLTQNPEVTVSRFRNFITHLDLSGSALTHTHFLNGWSHLRALILDNNNISESQSIPFLTSLDTLSLRNNQITNLPEFVEGINVQCPRLAHLTLLGNVACPLAYPPHRRYNYRIYVLSKIRLLASLDEQQVTQEEARHAACTSEEQGIIAY